MRKIIESGWPCEMELVLRESGADLMPAEGLPLAKKTHLAGAQFFPSTDVSDVAFVR